MEIKLADKKIIIRKFNKSDLKNAKAFQAYVNALVKENAMIGLNEKVDMKGEREYLNNAVKKSKKKIHLVAMYDGSPVGASNIILEKKVSSHIGTFGISIAKDYRGIGLGKKLMTEIIELAKKKLDPKPKIIQIKVYATNKPAIALYKKMGFKIVAKLPKQVQYKGKLVDDFIMNKYL
ncbi:MAG: GNAT family N-acetyltransferase [Candidatus Staskawiczbacteria bacterium]